MLQTCTRCRNRRIKCDSLLPACANCAKADLECTFRDEAIEEDIPRSYIKGLYDRIEELQSDLALQQQQPTCFSYSMSQDSEEPQTKTIAPGQSFHVVGPGSGEYLYLGLSLPALVTWSISRSLSITSSAAEPRFGIEESGGWQNLSKIDRSILTPRTVRFLLGRYDKRVRPQYPIITLDPAEYADIPLKRLSHLKKFNVIMSCAIAAALESFRTPEWRIFAKTCREWVEELAPRIVAAGNGDAVSAVLLMVVYEMLDPARGIMWELLGLAIRLCLQLGWHRPDQVALMSLNDNQHVGILKSIERSLRLLFGRETTFHKSVFPVTSSLDVLFDTYTGISAELYGDGGIYEAQRCPFTTKNLASMNVLNETTCEESIVQDCWLLFLPICLEHDGCAFCAPHADDNGAKTLTTLRKSVLQAASHQLRSIQRTVISDNLYFSPILASSQALPAGCAVVAGISKGWTTIDSHVHDLMRCTEILTFCSPHWKGGSDYLDIWRTISGSWC